ncbi:MAG: hypothetical protein KAH67_05305 [Flavobacteriaceae bacterium]|nr:hypothetical protein [Flavobacteriaceae bacterium]
MTLNNKVLQLPDEQLTWLLLMKEIFKRTYISNTETKIELIKAVKQKAILRGFNDINLLFNSNDLEKYLKK